MFAVTGTWGVGKTTVLEALSGQSIIQEPGRLIVAANPALESDGPGFARAFHEHSTQSFEAAPPGSVFDRGVVDALAYARYVGIDNTVPFEASVETQRYGRRVLFFPFWPEIYVNDELRNASPDRAKGFEGVIVDAYQDSGYELVDVPKLPIEERVSWVAEFLGDHTD